MGYIDDDSAPERGRFRSAVRFAQVQTELKNRRRRLDFLRAELLMEPTWDILLHVYSFGLLQRRVTVPELLARIDIPSTTAIRWVKLLEAEGLLDRTIDSDEPMQVNVALTSKALEAMDGYFSGILNV